jgi:predicted TIM-barrel fold metal-dependent hydrolase
MIDAHVHYLRPEWADALWSPAARRGSSVWPKISLRLIMLADPPVLMDALDTRAVAQAVIYPELSVAPGPQMPGGVAAALALTRAMNDATAALVARTPKRLAGLAVVNPLGGPEDLAELKRAILALGLRGVAVGASYHGATIAAPAARPFLELAQALDIPVVIHPSADGGGQMPRDYGLDLLAGMPLDLTALAVRLIVAGTLDAFPRLRLVLPHLGAGLPALLGWLAAHADPAGPSAADRARRFWCDTATATPAVLALAIETFGGDHIIYGSDWPLSATPRPGDPATDPAAMLGKLPIGSVTRSAILEGNAHALFGAW